MFRLDDRTAFITGGSGALGSAIADLFTQAGARVVLAGRHRVAGDYPSVAFDVTDDGEVASGVAEARGLLGGRIDILVEQRQNLGGPLDVALCGSESRRHCFTKSLALEVSEQNVLANVISPGPFERAMVVNLTEEWKNAKMRELPLGRFGRPEEVAPTALLLASEPGGNLFVGQTLGPNSGDVMP